MPLDQAQLPQIHLVSSIAAEELAACDFSFEVTHEIAFPFDDLDSVRSIVKRHKDYGFDPDTTFDDSSGRKVLIAVRLHGKLVGYAAITESWNGMAEVAEIAVDRQARGQGIGGLLLGSAEEWAREQGFRYLRLETQASNSAACRLYKNSGFKLGGFDRFLYAGGKDEGDTALFWYRKLPQSGG